MRSVVILFIALNATCFFSCSGDDPVSPQSTGLKLLQSDDIGSAGGSIELENIVIDIPQGAFAGVNEVRLYQSTEMTNFDKNLITSKYVIDGLPDTFEQPINIRLKNDGSTMDDTCQMAIGRGGYNPEIKDTSVSDYAYEIITIVDSSGWLSYQIPAFPAMSFASKSNYEIYSLGHYLVQVFGLEVIYEKVNFTNFVIYYNKDQNFDYLPTANILDETLEGIRSAGYDLDGMGLPHRLFIEYDDKTEVNMVVSKVERWKKRATFYVNVNRTTGQSNHDYRVLLGTKFYQYLPVLFNIQMGEYQLRWFSYAFMTWAEDKFNPPSHCGDKFQGNQMAPFRGMQAAVYRSHLDAKTHGYGMSTFLKYIVRQYSETALVHAINHMKSQASHPIEAFDQYVSESRDIWLTDYFKYHILGDPCEFDPNEMISAKSGEFIINTANDTLKKFDHAFYDLTARTYFIGLNYNEIGENDIISISASSDSIYQSDLNILVFAYKNNTLRFINQGNSVTIGNLASYKSVGENLVAVVINSNADIGTYFSRTSDVNLAFQYKQSIGVNFRSVRIRCTIVPEFQYDHGSTYWAESFEMAWVFTGSSSNGVFTSTEPDYYHPDNATGSMTVEFDPITYDIISYDADVSYIHTGYENMRTDMSISGANVPHFSSVGWEMARVIGETTCNSISSIGYFNVFDINNYNWVTLKSYKCSTNSVIAVEMWD